MTNSQRLSLVRTALRRWIASRDEPAEHSSEPIAEAMLICNGFYRGRRFRCGAYHAVWFIEEDELKVFHADGRLAERLDSDAVEQLAGAGRTPVEMTADEPHTVPFPARQAEEGTAAEHRRAA